MAAAEPPSHPPCPAFEYTTYEVDEYDVPYATHVANQPAARIKYTYVANGAVVIDEQAGTTQDDPDATAASSTPTTVPKVLLLQRAAHDSMPGLWEVPGGACDPDDPSILYSVARELWEEAGLTAARIGPLVGGPEHVFRTRSGKLVCRLAFLVGVERVVDHAGVRAPLRVVLDPNEHQAYVWASEDEVQAGVVGELEVPFTHRQVKAGVLEAFQVRRDLEREGV